MESEEEEGLMGPRELILNQHADLYDLIHVAGDVGLSMSFLLVLLYKMLLHESVKTSQFLWYLQKHWKRDDLKAGLRYLLDSHYIYTMGVRHRK